MAGAAGTQPLGPKQAIEAGVDPTALVPAVSRKRQGPAGGSAEFLLAGMLATPAFAILFGVRLDRGSGAPAPDASGAADRGFVCGAGSSGPPSSGSALR